MIDMTPNVPPISKSLRSTVLTLVLAWFQAKHVMPVQGDRVVKCYYNPVELKIIFTSTGDEQSCSSKGEKCIQGGGLDIFATFNRISQQNHGGDYDQANQCAISYYLSISSSWIGWILSVQDQIRGTKVNLFGTVSNPV